MWYSFAHCRVDCLRWRFPSEDLSAEPTAAVALQVMPVLFAVVRAADEQLRLFLLQRLTGLLAVLRQHLRRWLPDLVALVHEFWDAGPDVLADLLRLVSELASAHAPVSRARNQLQ